MEAQHHWHHCFRNLSKNK